MKISKFAGRAAGIIVACLAMLLLVGTPAFAQEAAPPVVAKPAVKVGSGVGAIKGVVAATVMKDSYTLSGKWKAGASCNLRDGDKITLVSINGNNSPPTVVVNKAAAPHARKFSFKTCPADVPLQIGAKIWEAAEAAKVADDRAKDAGMKKDGGLFAKKKS